mgnify:CR=1 FL=1
MTDVIHTQDKQTLKINNFFRTDILPVRLLFNNAYGAGTIFGYADTWARPNKKIKNYIDGLISDMLTNVEF